jgi:CheY-like chemotaxis protein
MKALVVEDEEGIATVLRKRLEGLGLTVVVTGSLEEAVLTISNPPAPEIITLDLNLLDSPVQDTINRVKELRRLTPDSLLLVVSGVMTDYDRERLQRMGANATIEKMDITTEKSFLSKLSAVWDGLVTSPQKHLRNYPLMEALAKRVTERYNELELPLGIATETKPK